MSNSLTEDAHAVLFPAFDGVTLSDPVRRYLDRGGVSILIGESRAEYVAREMSVERKATESPETFQRLVRDASRPPRPLQRLSMSSRVATPVPTIPSAL